VASASLKTCASCGRSPARSRSTWRQPRRSGWPCRSRSFRRRSRSFA